MPRIPVHTLESAPEDSRDALKALDAKFGKVLNIHGEMAHSPVVLQAYVALQQVIAEDGSSTVAPGRPLLWQSAMSMTAPTARRPTPEVERLPGCPTTRWWRFAEARGL